MGFKCENRLLVFNHIVSVSHIHFLQRCRDSNPPTTSPQDAHLSCDIIGRPCCIGILAKCVIASLEYCNYMKGRYHEEAFLCSQVIKINLCKLYYIVFSCLTDTYSQTYYHVGCSKSTIFSRDHKGVGVVHK